MPNKSPAVPADPKSRYGGVGSRRGPGAVQLSQVKGDFLSGAIDAVVSVGDALLFARTSDGGALVIRAIHEGTSEPIYCADASELLEALEGLKEAALSS